MEGMDNNISKEEWSKYFMEILEGEEKERTEKEKLQVNSGAIEEGRKENGNKKINKENKGVEEAKREQLEEEELKDEEINEAIHRMKIKKASGVDKIPMEAWRSAGTGMKGELKKLIKEIWKEGEISKEWKKSII